MHPERDWVETDVLIVGAGHAGAQAAMSLRQRKYAGRIALLWGEGGLPYERPPLSKDYLAGLRPDDRLLLRPQSFWDAQRIDLLPGRRVVGIDAAAHQVSLEDGGHVRYRQLVWAAGGQARGLGCDGAQLAGVHTLRSREDAIALRESLRTARNVAVIGGGYIGLEVTATLAKPGRRVTLVESQERVLARVAGPLLSAFYEAEHRSHGIDLRLGTGVEALGGRDGHVASVQLGGGAQVPADVVIVGIGILPAVAPLVAVGAADGRGVPVDAACRTRLEDVYAIGDCSLQQHPHVAGGPLRLECVQNAVDQAAIVARVLTGAVPPAATVPWFWSEQYDLRLQTAGVATGFDECVSRGDPGTRSFSLVYLRGGRVIAVDSVNQPRDFAQAKALVACGAAPPRDRLADPAVTLRELAG
jgi:3-phenylpropionate/trans-cinnamate dioxygenase ferredoxin reductase subunit